jgi:glycosyltransferase involved in cell wall biosynthesis
LTAPLLIALLAHDEAACIAGVVAELRSALPGAQLLVVDDGSQDQTAILARQAGAKVLRHPVNLGVAAAEATALRYAARCGHLRMVRMDADGQHDPASLGALLAAADAGAELVVGSRYLEAGDGSPRRSTTARRVGSLVLGGLLRAASGAAFTDPTSGLRLFAGRALPFFARAMLHDYPEPESLLLARRQGFKVTEVAVRMRPRWAGQSSLTPLGSAFYMAKVCLALSLELLRPRST